MSLGSLTLSPIKRISGKVDLPGSKSLSNRVLLLSMLAEGTTHIRNLLDSDDVRYMIGALEQLGIRMEETRESNEIRVEGCASGWNGCSVQCGTPLGPGVRLGPLWSRRHNVNSSVRWFLRASPARRHRGQEESGLC